MRVEVLGPVRALVDGQVVDLGGARNRALLARLALAAGRPVSAATLVDDLWGDDPPADPTGALQSVVSRTRRRLPAGAIELGAAGYVLRAEESDLSDVDADPTRVDLWRGPALADVSAPFVDDWIPGLDERWLTATERDLERRLRGGVDADLVTRLADLTREHPYRERLWALRIEALAVAGRPAEALEVYETVRRRLADDLGTDPSPALQELHLTLLRGESASRRPSRLPSALTSFVGREDAVRSVRDAINRHRLATIVGPGGAGKTRLAIEAARTLDQEVWLVELASVASGADIVRLVLGALDLVEVTALEPRGRVRDERDRLLEAVAQLQGVLILDNCEHVVDAAAALTEDLLSHAADLRVLATSREPLRIPGEHVLPIEPLRVPDLGVTADDAVTSSAVRLFVDRAVAADPTFVLDDDTVPQVLDICRRLDGQPLAIELAAARLRTLGLRQVAERLGDRFRLLTGGSRTALPRHRTLRAVVEWSWDLLDDVERDVAERVSVFPAGVTAAGAAAVSRLSQDGAADVLEALADKSLLVPVRTAGPPRFRMLETLREFGVDRLVERGIVVDVRSAHLDHVVAFLTHHDDRLRGPEQLASLAAIDLEWGNIAAALRFAIDAGDRVRAGRILVIVAWYWAMRGDEGELAAWVGEVMALDGLADPSTEVVLNGLSVLESLMADGRGSASRHVEAILAAWDTGTAVGAWVDVVLATIEWFGLAGDRVLRPPSDPWTRGAISLMQVMMADNAGDDVPDLDRLHQAIEFFTEAGDRSGLASALGALANELMLAGRTGDALDTLRRAEALLTELGAQEDLGFVRSRMVMVRIAEAPLEEMDSLRDQVLAVGAGGGSAAAWFVPFGLGAVERRLGRPREAARLIEARLDQERARQGMGSPQARAGAEAALATALAECGELDRAGEVLTGALDLAEKTRDMPVVSLVSMASVALALACGDHELAVRRLGAVEAIRGRADLSSRDAREFADAARSELGEEAFARIFASARALTKPQALALVRPDQALAR